MPVNPFRLGDRSPMGRVSIQNGILAMPGQKPRIAPRQFGHDGFALGRTLHSEYFTREIQPDLLLPQ